VYFLWKSSPTPIGFGEMAVASAVGSNTFDVLVGLGVPWLVKTSVVDPGGKVSPSSTKRRS
jgi:Ca2+/Na+ antiporter